MSNRNVICELNVCATDQWSHSQSKQVNKKYLKVTQIQNHVLFTSSEDTEVEDFIELTAIQHIIPLIDVKMSLIIFWLCIQFWFDLFA